MCRTPAARATSAVPSVDPSSMTSTSIVSMPGISRGRSRSVDGSVSASFRHGIWMISFFIEHCSDQLLNHPIPRDTACALVSGVAETGGQSLVSGKPVDRQREGLVSRLTHEPVRFVLDELERTAGIGRGNDRLVREERFERHVTVVLVEGAVDDGEGAP